MGGGKIRIQGVPQPQATTNRQTTIICSKLGIYDPMALLLGTATATRPSMAGLSLSSYSSSNQDSTMAAASARLASLTPSVVADKEVLEKSKTKEEKKEEEAEKVKLAIPAPKEDQQASNQDFLAVLDSIGNGSTKDSEKGEGGNVESINDLFCIDKTGADDDEEEVKPPPVKQLKRRNAS